MKILLDHSTTKNYSMSIKLYANSNILVIGSSGSGKTTAVLKIIEEKLIEPMPKNIFYLFGAHQPFMDDMTNIEFVKGLDLSVINNYKGPKLLIIDDLILELNKELANHFIAGSHYRLQQYLLCTGYYLSNNNQYILLFKNKRNFSQVSCLGRQILGEDYGRLVEAYKYVKSFEFVLLSFHPLVPDDLLVIADFFKTCPSVFI